MNPLALEESMIETINRLLVGLGWGMIGLLALVVFMIVLHAIENARDNDKGDKK